MSELKIRAACPDDAAAITEFAIQPTVVWGTFQLPAQAVSEWHRRLSGNDANTAYQLVAELDGKVVATAGIHWFARPRIRHVGSLNMLVHEAYQGRGVGKALMAALVDVADRWLNLVRVELEVFADNERAIKLYRSFGFAVEGCKRLHAFRDGRYADSLFMARICPGIGNGVQVKEEQRS